MHLEGYVDTDPWSEKYADLLEVPGLSPLLIIQASEKSFKSAG